MEAENNVVALEKPEKRQTHKYWVSELEKSRKTLEKWHERGTRIVQRYLGEDADEAEQFKLNLFHSNIKTLQDMMYNRVPRVEASRAHNDANDDVARVAAEIIERVINLDIAANGEEYDAVLRSCLQDRLLPGNGVARVRYEVETEIAYVDDGLGNMVEMEQVVSEAAPLDYYHWQDVLWGWSRSFASIPWIAFRTYMSKAEIAERFGEEFAEKVDYSTQKLADTGNQDTGNQDNAPWQKAQVWEIWDKVAKKVCWFSPGAERLLDTQDDPLGLRGFFPCPPFLIANATTALYRPTPDYILHQDLYNEIDVLQTRIAVITEAVRVVGVYDASSEGIKRMLEEGVDNDLIPVDNWAMFAEGGGLKAKIDWFPILDVVNTLDKLRQLRDDTIRLLQMSTGMADVMQGALNSPYEGVGQSQMKADFGSVRVQSLQDQFATFAGDLMQLKAEVVCKHFEPQTILQQANAQFTAEQQEIVMQAVQLLKQPNMAYLRIIVRPESMAITDYGRLKAERTEFLNALSTDMQSAAPMLQQQPSATPFLLQLLQWTLSGFKGSQQIEGVIDQAITASMEAEKQKQQQPEKPDPEQIKLQGELQKIQAKGQADMQMRQADLQADMMTAEAQHAAKMKEIQATHMSRMEQIYYKLEADLRKEEASVGGDIAQLEVGAEVEIEKDITSAALDMQKEREKAAIEISKEMEKTRNKLDEIAASSVAKLRELRESANIMPKERPDDSED